MNVFNLEDFPFVEFGNDPKRKVRILVSPHTTGEQRCSVVVSTVSPGGVSEGHVHDKSDEYIYFDIGGKFIVEGVEHAVKEKGLAFAPRGANHECINTAKDKDLNLLCFFLPPFELYGKYPELIEKTNELINKESKR